MRKVEIILEGCADCPFAVFDTSWITGDHFVELYCKKLTKTTIIERETSSGDLNPAPKTTIMFNDCPLEEI